MALRRCLLRSSGFDLLTLREDARRPPAKAAGRSRGIMCESRWSLVLDEHRLQWILFLYWHGRRILAGLRAALSAPCCPEHTAAGTPGNRLLSRTRRPFRITLAGLTGHLYELDNPGHSGGYPSREGADLGMYIGEKGVAAPPSEFLDDSVIISGQSQRHCS